MLAPYVLVFLAFVLYPVSYGLWLARHPESYVRLFDDPIFFRTVVNTILFLVIAVNLKFLLALWLSGFFVHERAVDPLDVGALPAALGSAVDPDHLLDPLHVQPRVGRDQLDDLQAHRRWTGRTG